MAAYLAVVGLGVVVFLGSMEPTLYGIAVGGLKMLTVCIVGAFVTFTSSHVRTEVADR